MNKKTFVSIIVVLVIIIVGVIVLKKAPKNEVQNDPTLGQEISITGTGTFMCSNGKSIDAIFTENSAIIAVNDQVLELPQTISASGARYANADESFVFWEKGGTAFVEESGVVTYDECVTVNNTPEISAEITQEDLDTAATLKVTE